MRRLRLALFLAVLTAAGGAEKSLTILHVNDLHARLLPLENGRGGFARLAAVIRRERAVTTDSILLNAGDLVQGSPVSTIFKGVPIFQIANRFGFTAATFGNHDFDYGWQTARRFLHTARYPIVNANVVDREGRLFTKKPDLVVKVNGLRIGILGAMTDTLASLTTPDLLGPWKTVPAIETVRREAARLRERVDLVVVLAHITDKEELEMLRSVRDVAVIVSGHVHRGLPVPVVQDGRLVVRVRGYGEELGRLALRIDPERKAIASWDWKRVPVEPSVAPDEAVARDVERWEKSVSRIVDRPLATSARLHSVPEVKSLIERAMQETMRTDFAFMNMGGVRDTIHKGPLKVRHIWHIMPFDNIVVVGRFKGSELPSKVTLGRSIDPLREYTFAVSDFTAENQGVPSQLGVTGLVFPTRGPLLRDVLIDWIGKKKRLE